MEGAREGIGQGGFAAFAMLVLQVIDPKLLARRSPDRDLGSDLGSRQRTHLKGRYDRRGLCFPPLGFLIDQGLELLVSQAGEVGPAVDLPRRLQFLLEPIVVGPEPGVGLLNPPEFLARRCLRELALEPLVGVGYVQRFGEVARSVSAFAQSSRSRERLETKADALGC